MLRWLLGKVPFPLCAITTWTFFSEFSNTTLTHQFWKTAAFWYFTTGGFLMTGWFANVLILVALMCPASDHMSFRSFINERVTNVAHSWDTLDWLLQRIG
ncbi:MAG: hypothetical protein OSB74_11650 [Verrucomicrobiota bacterium]|nr:hypothetical protein [Verrucomicrobiota bacterium]|tara:strand:+ start:268 stop:567 length:300 start_codon:yes stop_codon:yes gene_type:complete